MNIFFSACLILFSTFSYGANVTFHVDMSITPASNDGVYIVDTTEGSSSIFMGPEGLQMTEISDNTWEIVLSLDPGTYNYKFRNGFCDDFDNCSGWEDALSNCGVGEWNDRQIVVGDNDIIEGPYCFNSCELGPCGEAPDTFPITFSVDMSIIGANPTGVYLVGGNMFLQGPLGILMNDDDENDIWEVTVDLPPGTYNFKFRNGECSTWDSCPQEFWEDFEGECGVGEWGDRQIVVTDESFTYGPYCFDFCDQGECQPNVPIDVTFQVELTDEQMEMANNCDGVFVYGNFNNFDLWVNPWAMQNDQGSNIYILDETFTSNDQLLYKYSICSGANAIAETDEGVGGCGISMGECSSDVNWREEMVPYTSGPFELDYFDTCPGLARVTMSVDMNNESVPGSGVCVAGGTMPNGAQGTPLCDPDGDGIYSATLSFPYDSHQTYKFVNGCGDTWENPGFEDLPSSCTEGQWNDRYFDVYEDNQLEGPHIFGECSGDTSDDGGGNSDTNTVTFNLDGIDDCDFVSITGTFDNWSGWGIPYSDGVTSIDLEDGSYEYLILCVSNEGEWWNDIWANATTVGAPLNSDCDAIPGDEFPNYGFTLNGSDINIDLCLGTCNASCSNLSTNISDITDFNISNIYPNPFNPITTITYQVPEYSNVSIKIYNLSGQIIQNIHNGFMSPGEYSVSWDAKNFSSGLYFVKMISGPFVKTQKIMLVK
tara:strand:- start:4007 stop:6139 length:2133 start_codon:yes stop_codon:yes gene_type:complete